jgi:glutamate-1-semialdehyde 2,1-aminomutase
VTRSDDLFARAQRVIPGGVNSPVRAFGAVGGTPVFYRQGRGARVVDADGRELIDLVASWGPLILGHAHPAVVAAVCEAARRGTTFGAPTAAEVELAETVAARMPAVEKLRLVSSGTEAGMSAARLARGFTRRDRIVKFAGCYHGHADSFLIAAGSGALTFGTPSSPGVPAELAKLTHLARFNDLEGVRAILEAHRREVAAVFVEPVAGNIGVVPPRPGFLEGLRALCDEHGALLVLDEVITGFRVAAGGAQELYRVRPDLVMLGKVLGGGLPLAGFGGRAEILDRLAPSGPVYQAGTLSGNPLATAAGLATLRELGRPGVYEELGRKSARLQAGLEAAVRGTGIAAVVQRVASMLTLFFQSQPVESLDSLAAVDTRRYARFFHGMLARGVALPPSQYEALFVSTAHTDADIDQVVAAAREVLSALDA